MAEYVAFVESFDHAGPAYAPSKYVHARGTYTEVPGPYHGVAARFAAQGNDLGPAQLGLGDWDSGAWSAAVRVDATGWTGSGEVALLAPCWFGFQVSAWVDFPHHWLTVDATGTLRVRSWATLSGSATAVLAASAPGALPLGVWTRLEYRTQLRTDSTSAGTVGVRVDGVEVLAASGLVTTDRQRAVAQAGYVRFGHLEATPGNTGGVAGLGSGGEAVPVAVDDVCQRADDALGAPLLPYRDDPAAPHRVVCLRPTGPGAATEFPLVGAAANWQANAEAPPDGDASYVERVPVATAAELPLDLYATAPAPAFAEDAAAGAALLLWGLASVGPGPAPTATLATLDGLGTDGAQEVPLKPGGAPDRPWRYARAGPGGPLGLSNALLAGYQIGWGVHWVGLSPLAQAYRATQLVAELWYRPAAPDPEPTPGAQHWSVGWIGAG